MLNYIMALIKDDYMPKKAILDFKVIIREKLQSFLFKIKTSEEHLLGIF